MVGRALDLSDGVASVRPRQRLVPVLGRLGEHALCQPWPNSWSRQLSDAGSVFSATQRRYRSAPATMGTADTSGLSQG